jgi:hypothetical protein
MATVVAEMPAAPKRRHAWKAKGRRQTAHSKAKPVGGRFLRLRSVPRISAFTCPVASQPSGVTAPWRCTASAHCTKPVCTRPCKQWLSLPNDTLDSSKCLPKSLAAANAHGDTQECRAMRLEGPDLSKIVGMSGFILSAAVILTIVMK